MADEQLAARLALMTLRAKFDDGSGHAPSLGDGIAVLPDIELLPRETATTLLARLAVERSMQFLHCTAKVIDGHLAIDWKYDGDPAHVAHERAFFAQMIAEERAKYGPRPSGAEVLVIDGVDRRERFELRWEDILAFVHHYRGDAFGGSFSWPGDEGAPLHIGAVFYTHQASGIIRVDFDGAERVVGEAG